jgi:hypothetical protein
MTRIAMRLAALLVLAPVAAYAQSATPPDQPGTLRLGTLTVKPLFALKNISRDNNVFNEPDNPKSDFTMTVSPSAEVVVQPARFKFTFLFGTDYVYFQHYASERGTNGSASGRLDVDLGVLRPYATIAGVSTKDRYNNEVDARARHHDQSYSAGVGLKLFTRTTGTVGFKHAVTRFDEGETFRGQDLSVAFDSRIDTIEGSIGMALTPLTSFDVNVSHEEQRFEHARERDANSLRIMPTLRFSPAGVVNGTVAVGYRRFTALDPVHTPDFSGVVASASAGFTLYERHRFDFTVNRDLNYSYDLDVSYYIATGESITWTWLFAGPLDLKTSAGRNQMRYQGAGDIGPTTADTYIDYSAGFGYRPRPRLRLGIAGDWVSRASQTSADRIFENNRIYGTLTWGT